MWGIIISIVMAIIIGIIGDALVGHEMPGGIIGSMIAGFVGAWLGPWLFGAWGLSSADLPLCPLSSVQLSSYSCSVFAKLFRRTA